MVNNVMAVVEGLQLGRLPLDLNLLQLCQNKVQMQLQFRKLFHRMEFDLNKLQEFVPLYKKIRQEQLGLLPEFFDGWFCLELNMHFY